MGDKNLAFNKENFATNPCEILPGAFVAQGAHRFEGGTEQTAPKESGIARLDSQKGRFPIEEASQPDPAGTSSHFTGNPTYRALEN